MPHRESLSGFIDPDGPAKDQSEEEIAAFFGEQFQDQFDEIIKGINKTDPQTPDNEFWERWAAIFAAFLIPHFTRSASEAAETQIAELGIGVDDDLVLAGALRFAESHAFSLVQGLNEKTQKHLQNAIAGFIADPNKDFNALIDNISNQFGPTRAERIAITETTRAFEEGKRIYQDQLTKIGVKTDLRWHTMQDERVCPICEPNDGKLKSEGWTAAGIPAHPRDRCWTTIEVVN